MARSSRGPRPATSSHDISYCPDAGDIVILSFDPQSGSEQKGRRPAIVLSPRRYNAASKLCVVCPITNRSKGYPFEVAIADNAAGITGVVLSDQVKSLSWGMRGAAFAGAAPEDVLRHVRAKLKALLSMT